MEIKVSLFLSLTLLSKMLNGLFQFRCYFVQKECLKINNFLVHEITGLEDHLRCDGQIYQVVIFFQPNQLTKVLQHKKNTIKFMAIKSRKFILFLV